MFKLKNFFFFSGGGAIFIFVVLFTFSVYQHDSRNVEKIGERENLLLAGFLSDFIFQNFDIQQILTAETNQPMDVTRLQNTISNFAELHHILKVKIFRLNGYTLFSTVPEEVGKMKSSDGLAVASATGQAWSVMVFKESFSSLEGTLFNRNIVETYIPIKNSAGMRIGVFELYSDVTDLLEKSRNSLYELLALLIAGYILLFLFLYMLVRRADHIIENQYRELNESNLELDEVRVNLEKTVETRTSALRETVEHLEQEMKVRQEAELEQRKLSVAVEQSPTAILIMDTAGVIQYANPRFTERSGWPGEEVEGEHCKAYLADSVEAEAFTRVWNDVLKGETWQGEVVNRNRGGENYIEFATISPVLNEEGKIDFILSNSEDITSRKKNEEEIYHLAHHDTLTGLYNRFSLEQRLEQAIVQSERSRNKLAVLFLDLDRFKNINDTLGHKAGDELLQQVATRLKSICRRRSDIVARLGGDEFVVILTEIEELAFVALTAQTVVQVLSMPYQFQHHELNTSPSVGISVFPGDGLTTEELLKNADTAMYHVKQSGRGNYSFFEEDMNQLIAERFTLEKDLRMALQDNSGLELFYQPQVCMKTDRICGVEALLRWHHPEQGFISPEKFIPVAEDSGVIYELGNWVIASAFKCLLEWQSRGLTDVHMALNISARQLEGEEFVADLEEMVKKMGIDPGMVELEVTESTAMKNPEKSIEKLKVLRKLGFELAIDDFGTGYSSLSYLKMLPIQTLKLDRAFVNNLENDVNNAAICKASISLSHDLGFKVVAEGVETEAQQHFLKRHGGDILQGYFFSKPVPAADVEKYIRLFNNEE